MGDHHHRLAHGVDRGPQQGEDLPGGGGVEVARGLVGEHHRGPRRDGTGDGHALLLAPGKLGGPVIEPVHEPEGLRHLRQPLLGDVAPGDGRGQGDVVARTQGRDQVEPLEDEADGVASQGRQGIVVEGGEVVTVQDHPARGGCVEAGQELHQRGLAGSRGTHDGREVASHDVQVHPVQGLHRARAASVHLGQVECAHHDLAGHGDVPGATIRAAPPGPPPPAARPGMGGGHGSIVPRGSGAGALRGSRAVHPLRARRRGRGQELAGLRRGDRKTPGSLWDPGVLVAPTGVDPVTFRFSVERSTN